MQSVNGLLGKGAINQATGERIAPVRDIVLSADMRSIVALVLGTGGLFSDDRVVPWPQIVSLGDVVVVDGGLPLGTLKDHTDVAALRKGAFQITGASVISASGEKIGTVSDMLADSGGRILGYTVKQGGLANLLGSRFLPSEQVQTIGKDAILTTVTELMSLKEYEQAGPPALTAPPARSDAPITDPPALSEPPATER